MLTDLRPLVATGGADLVTKLDARLAADVDHPRLAAVTVTGPWRSATPDQQPDLDQAFRRVVRTTYLTQLSTYAGRTASAVGEGVNTGGSRTVMVSIGPGQLRLEYLDVGGSRRIHDFGLNGVSFVKRHAPGFAAVIKRDGIDALIAEPNQ